MSATVVEAEAEHFDQLAFCWHCHQRYAFLVVDPGCGKLTCLRCIAREGDRLRTRRKKHRRRARRKIKLEARFRKQEREDKLRELRILKRKGGNIE